MSVTRIPKHMVPDLGPGPIILNFTFPILFIAVLGCLYLHLGKKNISVITTSKRDTKLRFLKRPMIVKGVGIVTVTELTLFTSFIALCVWYFADYVRHWFKQAPMLAMTRHEQIRVCGNPHAIIRKYGLMCCRQCFRSNAKEIGFIKSVRAENLRRRDDDVGSQLGSGLVRYHMNKLKEEFGFQIILDDIKVDESFEFAAREIKNDCL